MPQERGARFPKAHGGMHTQRHGNRGDRQLTRLAVRLKPRGAIKGTPRGVRGGGYSPYSIPCSSPACLISIREGLSSKRGNGRFSPDKARDYWGSSGRRGGGGIGGNGGGVRCLGGTPLRRTSILLCAFLGLHDEAGKAKQHIDCHHDYDIPGKFAHDPILLCSLRRSRPAGKRGSRAR